MFVLKWATISTKYSTISFSPHTGPKMISKMSRLTKQETRVLFRLDTSELVQEEQ
jgi:hypothetical protein